MELIGHWGLALVLGLAGWRVAQRLRMPVPTVLGAMLMVGAGSILGALDLTAAPQIRIGLQMIIGTYAGYRFDQEASRRLKTMVPAVAGVTLWTVASALLVGFLLSLLTGMALPTALLGTAPGGLPEMSAVALTMHADVAVVATISATRLIAAMMAIPFMARRASGQTAGLARAATPLDDDDLGADALAGRDTRAVSDADPRRPRQPWLWTVLLGIGGGTLFTILQVPAAGVMGSLLSVAAGRIRGVPLSQPPVWLRTTAQLGIGIIIGTTFTPQTLSVLGQNALPVLGAAAATVASGLALSGVLQRTLKVDHQTALLACSPAGVTQMAVLSEELGAQTFVVSLFQLTRLTAVVVVMPLIFRAILQ